jgi:outer membrane receptor protein involved in Fe transport
VENVFNYVYLGDQSALINAYQQGSLGGVGGPLIETSFQNVQNAFVQPFYGLGRNWQLTFKYKFGNKPQKL